MTSRLALDVRRVTLTFDPTTPAIAIESRALSHGYVVLARDARRRVSIRRRVRGASPIGCRRRRRRATAR